MRDEARFLRRDHTAGLALKLRDSDRLAGAVHRAGGDLQHHLDAVGRVGVAGAGEGGAYLRPRARGARLEGGVEAVGVGGVVVGRARRIEAQFWREGRAGVVVNIGAEGALALPARDGVDRLDALAEIDRRDAGGAGEQGRIGGDGPGGHGARLRVGDGGAGRAGKPTVGAPGLSLGGGRAGGVGATLGRGAALPHLEVAVDKPVFERREDVEQIGRQAHDGLAEGVQL